MFAAPQLNAFPYAYGSWYPEFLHIHVFMGIHETLADL